MTFQGKHLLFSAIIVVLVIGSWVNNHSVGSYSQLSTPGASPQATPVLATPPATPFTSPGTPLPLPELANPGITGTPVALQTNVYGNALELLEDGAPGELSVVASGRVEEGDLSIDFVLRNNASVPKSSIELGVILRDANGNLVGVKEGSVVYPEVLLPGEYAVGAVLDIAGFPTAESAEWIVNAHDGIGSNPSVNLGLAELSVGPNGVLGSVNNSSGNPLSGPVTVFGACFDSAGILADTGNVEGILPNLQPGDETPFQFEYLGRGSSPCAYYLVGAYGHP